MINSTNTLNEGRSKSDEDVLYQKGALFSAKLANDNNNNNYNNYNYNIHNNNVSNVINSRNPSNRQSNEPSDALSPMTLGEDGVLLPRTRTTTPAVISGSVEITDDLTIASEGDSGNDFLIQQSKDSWQPPILLAMQGPQNRSFSTIDMHATIGGGEEQRLQDKSLQPGHRSLHSEDCDPQFKKCRTESTATVASRSSSTSPKIEPTISRKDVWLTYNLAQGGAVEVKPRPYEHRHSTQSKDEAEKSANISQLGTDAASPRIPAK